MLAPDSTTHIPTSKTRQQKNQKFQGKSHLLLERNLHHNLSRLWPSLLLDRHYPNRPCLLKTMYRGVYLLVDFSFQVSIRFHRSCLGNSSSRAARKRKRKKAKVPSILERLLHMGSDSLRLHLPLLYHHSPSLFLHLRVPLHRPNPKSRRNQKILQDSTTTLLTGQFLCSKLVLVSLFLGFCVDKFALDI